MRSLILAQSRPAKVRPATSSELWVGEGVSCECGASERGACSVSWIVGSNQRRQEATGERALTRPARSSGGARWRRRATGRARRR
jgi:hypothetical protein